MFLYKLTDFSVNHTPNNNTETNEINVKLNSLSTHTKGIIVIRTISTEKIIEISAEYLPFSPPNIILNPAFLYSLSLTQDIAIKWGNCQKNWIANNIPAIKPNSSVAATYPRRNGHFNGVATVIEKLFRIIHPNKAYFGQKDLQQLQIIKYLTKQLNFETEIIGVSTKREESGLAMSSRNKRLSIKDLEKATLIYKTLIFIKENAYKHSIKELKEICIQKFNDEPELNLEYLEIVSLENLHPIDLYNHNGHNAACIAASISSVRLIDNIIF